MTFDFLVERGCPGARPGPDPAADPARRSGRRSAEAAAAEVAPQGSPRDGRGAGTAGPFELLPGPQRYVKMALWATFRGFGPLFYILLESRYQDDGLGLLQGRFKMVYKAELGLLYVWS